MSMSRLYFLDGLRGLAALMVLFSHINVNFLQHTTKEFDVRFLHFFSDGQFAVILFFILSGFSLSIRYVNNLNAYGLRYLFAKIISRYFRLMIPIVVICVIAYILVINQLFFNLEAARHSPILSDWLGSFYNFSPSIEGLMKFSLFDVFLSYNKLTSYNSSLWTMTYEFLGSIMIFFIFYILKYIKYKKIFITFTFTFTFLSFPIYSCFILGMIMAYYQINYKIYNFRYFGFLFLSIIIYINSEFPFIIYQYSILMAFLLIFTVSNSSILKTFLSNEFFRTLGRISFSLYLVHLLIICSFSSFFFINQISLFSNLINSILIFSTTCILSIAFAFLLTPIDQYAIRFSDKIMKGII